MKALFIADAKPKEPLHKLAKNCEIVILLGDLFYDWIAELKKINIPIIGVSGNHDFDPHINPEKTDPLKKIGAINLHLNTFTYKEVRFTGFNGDMAYVYAENRISYWKGGEMDILRKELSELDNHVPTDVFITHYPSFGTLDMPHVLGHMGIKAFRCYIDRVQPKYHFHGHMHKPMTAQIGTTEVTCVFPYLIKNI